MPQSGERGPRRSGRKKRTGQHRRRRDRAVVAPRRARPVPDWGRLVVRADAPEPLGVGPALVRVARAESDVGPVRAGPGRPPVPPLTVPRAAQVIEARRHLRHEQGVRAAEHGKAFQLCRLHLPGVPRRRSERMRARAERQEIKKRCLAVALPARLEPAVLGLPAHRERHRACPGLAAVAHPGPVRPVRQPVGQTLDFRPRPVVTRHPRAQQQQGRVDRRQLALPDPRPSRSVHEVEEEAVLVLHPAADEAQRGQGARIGRFAADPAVRDADRQGRQRVPRRRNGGDGVSVRLAGQVTRPVFGQAGLGVGLVPEERERALLHRLQRRRGRRGADRPEQQEEQNSREAAHLRTSRASRRGSCRPTCACRPCRSRPPSSASR